MKKKLLDWNFCVTFVVTLFGAISIFVTASIFPDSSQLTPILDSYGHQMHMYGKSLFKMSAEPLNTPKIGLMLVREVIMFFSLLVLCTVMRPRERYPNYFTCDLSECP